MRCVAPILCVAGACASAGIGGVESDDGAVGDAGGSVDAPSVDEACEPIGAICPGIDGVVDVTVAADTSSDAYARIHPVEDGYLYTWTGDDTAWVVRLDHCGVAAPDSQRPLGAQRVIRSIVSSGTELGMISDRLNGAADVRFERLALDGTPIPGSAVSLDGLGGQSSLAWNPGAREWGAAWLHFDPADSGTWVSHVRFARIDASGTLVAGSNVRITDDSGADLGEILWAGDRFVIPWSHDVYVSLIERAADGAPIVEHELSVGQPHPVAPGVSRAGADYAVVWHSVRPGGVEVGFARADAMGFDAETASILGPDPAAAPTIASDGTEHAAAWYDDADIHVARIDGSGAVVESRVVTCAPEADFFPDIVWSDTHRAVAYMRALDHPDSELHLLLFARDGVNVGSFGARPGAHR